MKDHAIIESSLIAFQKITCKNQKHYCGSAICGLRVAYCVHSQRSELSLRIKKKKKSVCSKNAGACQSRVWLFDRETFFITAGRRAQSRSLRQQVGRSRIVRAPFIEIASGRLNNPPCRPQAIVFAGFSKNPGKLAGAARAICSSINIYAVMHITRA